MVGGDRRARRSPRAPIRPRSCAARSTPSRAARPRRRRARLYARSTSGGAFCCRRRCASPCPPLINEFIAPAEGLVAGVGGRHRRTDARQHEHRFARPIARSRPISAAGLFYLAINLCLAGLGASGRAAAGGGIGAMSFDVALALRAFASAAASASRSSAGASGRRSASSLGFAIALLLPHAHPAARWLLRIFIEIIPRHAVSGAVVPALFGRARSSACGSRRPRPASSASASIRRAYFAEIFPRRLRGRAARPDRGGDQRRHERRFDILCAHLAAADAGRDAAVDRQHC